MGFHPGFFLPPGWTKLFYSQAVEAVKYLLGLPEIMGIGLGIRTQSALWTLSEVDDDQDFQIWRMLAGLASGHHVRLLRRHRVD